MHGVDTEEIIPFKNWQILKNVLQQFGINDATNITPFGEGLINKTYLVKATNNQYILQHINSQVFTDVEAIDANMECLYKHDKEGLLVPIVRTIDGKISYKDSQNQYWRISKFIEKATAFSKIDQLYQAREGGKGVCQFP